MPWELTGNAGTTPISDFVGTSDAQPLVIRTNNLERMRVDPAGNVGVGTATPSALYSLGGASGIKQLVYDGNLNYNAGFGTDLIARMNSLDLFMGFGTGADTALNIVAPTGPWPIPGLHSTADGDQSWQCECQWLVERYWQRIRRFLGSVGRRCPGHSGPRIPAGKFSRSDRLLHF
jgi:hypothetical protein